MEIFVHVNSIKLHSSDLLEGSGIQHQEKWRLPVSIAEDRGENDTCVCASDRYDHRHAIVLGAFNTFLASADMFNILTQISWQLFVIEPRATYCKY